MKYSANYDKYPFVQVSYNSDDCISGWFAITDSISERLNGTGEAVESGCD